MWRELKEVLLTPLQRTPSGYQMTTTTTAATVTSAPGNVTQDIMTSCNGGGGGECWFSLLYFRPSVMAPIFKSCVPMLEAYREFPMSGYVELTASNLSDMTDNMDPLLVQVMLIFLFANIPPVRALFQPHCGDMAWLLAKGHLAACCSDLSLHFSPLTVTRDILQLWVDHCLQGLALGNFTGLIMSYDPDAVSKAFRAESGSTGLNETVVHDTHLTELSTLSKKRKRHCQYVDEEGDIVEEEMDANEDDLTRIKNHCHRTWRQQGEYFNALNVPSDSIIAQAERLMSELKDHTSVIRTAARSVTLAISPIFPSQGFVPSVHDVQVWHNALNRPDRMGKLHPLDPSRTWVPGDSLESIVKYAHDHQTRLMFAKAAAKKAQVAASTSASSSNQPNPSNGDGDDDMTMTITALTTGDTVTQNVTTGDGYDDEDEDEYEGDEDEYRQYMDDMDMDMNDHEDGSDGDGE